MILAACDFVSGLTALLQAGIMKEKYYLLINGIQKFSVDEKYFLLISYILAAVTRRTSIFYNLILAVIRTINIVQPFYLIRTKYVIISAVLYPILWVGISIADNVITLRVDGWSRVFWFSFVFNTDLISGLSYVRWHSMMYTASTTFPFLNASINPLILITRGSELREYVINCVLYTVRRITAVYRTCVPRRVNNDNVIELNQLGPVVLPE